LVPKLEYFLIFHVKAKAKKSSKGSKGRSDFSTHVRAGAVSVNRHQPQPRGGGDVKNYSDVKGSADIESQSLENIKIAIELTDVKGQTVNKPSPVADTPASKVRRLDLHDSITTEPDSPSENGRRLTS